MEDAPIEEIEVVAAAPNPEDGTVQVTVVAIDDTLPPSADLATAVQRAPGVVVKRLGGLGDWSSVSIRGSTARQVEVFLDGLPLNPEGGDVVNLSALPLWAFSSVQVFRGAAPIRLDTSASGGAVNLVTDRADGAQGSIAVGSWGTARMHVLGAGSAPVGRVFVSVDGLATDGGFRYFDDGGTRGDPNDDNERARSNNDTEQIGVLARWSVGDERLGLSLFDAWVHREEGVPGFTFAPLEGVRYGVNRHLPAVTAHGVVGATRMEARGWGVVRREERLDPFGELGSPDPVVTATDSVGLRGQLDTAASSTVTGTATASMRADALAGISVRRVGRLGAEAVLRGGHVASSIALRGLATDQGAWWLPRTGLRWSQGVVSVKAGVGQSVRIPDVTELYGDRGTLVGNPELRAERASSADASVTLQSDTARLEAGGFATRSDDRIVWERNAQGLARAANVERARLVGAEVAGELRWSLLSMQSNATLTRAENRSADQAYRGKQLPGVPWFEVWHRTGLDGGRWSLSHDLSFTAGTFDDPTNFTQQAPRVLQGAAVSVHDRPNVWALGLDVRNLTNRRTQTVPRDPLVDDGVGVPQPLADFVGMPLAGRTVMVSIRARR